MTIAPVRFDPATGALRHIVLPYLIGGTKVWDRDQRPAVVVSDIGADVLIRRADESYAWQPRHLLTERRSDQPTLWPGGLGSRVDLVFDSRPCHHAPLRPTRSL